jgi:anti-sigma regulatory factor (Ser/Thr protein kinase)
MAGDLLRLCVRCDEAAPGVVRDAMSQLPELGGVRDDAILVASELVTNAVRHSLCGPDDLLEIRVAGDGRLRISVLDPGVSGGRAQIVDRPTSFGGLGLKVVEQLADRWGSERGSSGYRVWAELPTAR